MTDSIHSTVSVVIPVYGVESFIAAAIQSVLDQTMTNFELLIVDDASPDRSVEICQQFTDPRIRIIRQENRGLAGSRNTGIRHARGEFLAFLDGDDLWQPEKLEQHLQHLEANPQIGISFSRSAFIDEAGNALGTYLMPQLTDITVADLFRANPVGNGSAAVIRRQVFEDIRFDQERNGIREDAYFDEAFRRSEDVECWLRILITTDWKMEGLSEALTLYRVNSTGLSANLYKQMESWEQVLAKVRTYAPELVAVHEKPAIAYYAQILARSAIRLGAGTIAVNLSNRAVQTYPQIVLEQPKRMLPTLTVAYLLWLAPKPLKRRLDAIVNKTTAQQQQRVLQQTHS